MICNCAGEERILPGSIAKVQTQSSYRWDDIRTFLAVWRGGSVSGAAKALGVNPSTIGRRLDIFEEALAARLFERTPEGVIATLAAERLVPFAEAVERAHHELLYAVQGLEREPEGVVKITGPPGLIDHFIAPAMDELRTTFPGLRIVLNASVGYADLSRGEADIALRARRPTSGDLIAKDLGPFPSCVIGARHLFDGVPPVTDTHALPWIQWDEDLLHIPDARWVSDHVDPERIVLRTSSISSQIEAARAGLGVFVAARPFGDLVGLIQVPWAGPGGFPDLPLYLVSHTALRRVPRVAVTWAFLRDHIGGAQGSLPSDAKADTGSVLQSK
jgi:DNA-binding transcriptional LysR family regulator